LVLKFLISRNVVGVINSRKGIYGGDLQVLKGLMAVILILAIACSNQEGPRLVEPDEPDIEVVEPTSTPTPDDLMTGRWVSIISETQSQEIDGLRIDVKQMRFSVPERLLPDLTDTELTEYGIVGIPSLIAMRINVENIGNEVVEFNPSGSGNVLTVVGVDTTPIFALTGETANLVPGDKDGFLIVFPVTSELADVHELTLTVRGLTYNYNEFNLKTPS
jgi:hypothetical protein